VLFCALHRKSPKFPIFTNSHQLNSIYPNPTERKFKFIADFFTSSTSSSHQILISSIIPNKSQKSPDLSPYLPTNFKHALEYISSVIHLFLTHSTPNFCESFYYTSTISGFKNSWLGVGVAEWLLRAFRI
jgi:hypothetical protein